VEFLAQKNTNDGTLVSVNQTWLAGKSTISGKQPHSELENHHFE